MRRKEEQRAERHKRELEREKEGRVEFLKVDTNGDRKLNMSLKVVTDEVEATVKLGLLSSGGAVRAVTGRVIAHLLIRISSRLAWEDAACRSLRRRVCNIRRERLRGRHLGALFFDTSWYYAASRPIL